MDKTSSSIGAAPPRDTRMGFTIVKVEMTSITSARNVISTGTAPVTTSDQWISPETNYAAFFVAGSTLRLPVTNVKEDGRVSVRVRMAVSNS